MIVMKNKELKIGDNIIYIDKIEQLGSSQDASRISHGALKWTKEQIEKALTPVVSIFDTLKNAAKDIEPDEMELEMQFSLSVNGETPVLKIVSATSSAQLSIKFVWKK